MKKYEHEEGICPVCREPQIRYIGREFGDIDVEYKWECRNCGSQGREIYTLDFKEHEIDFEGQISIETIWDTIVRNNIATDKELDLITDINGHSTETLNDVIYARTGYQDIIQYLESEETE